MSLFQCSKCGTRENTALSEGGYLARLIAKGRLRELGLAEDGKYCSECYSGTWHGLFPKEYYPLGSVFTDQYGNLVGNGLKFKSDVPIRDSGMEVTK